MVFSRAKASGERIGEVLETEGGEGTGRTRHGRLQAGLSFAKCPSAIRAWKRRASSRVLFCQPERNGCHYGRDRLRKINAFQLIPRLYTADSGSIFIDGKPIGEFSACGLRREIGYVPQEVLLFSGTIRENIAWGGRMLH